MMSPGTYLGKRREAAGLSLATTAVRLALLPETTLLAQLCPVDHLAWHLADAEEDRAPLDLTQAALLRRVFRLDLDVYEKLLLLHLAGPDSGLPEPQLCRTCACSWCDPCLTGSGPCGWVEGQHDLCTACCAAGAPPRATAPRIYVPARAAAQPEGAPA